jgi:hypothetical protein
MAYISSITLALHCGAAFVVGYKFLECAINGQRRDHQSAPPMPFLQILNVHRASAVVDTIARSEQLATVAKRLLATDSLRLYQTALFIKVR